MPEVYKVYAITGGSDVRRFPNYDLGLLKGGVLPRAVLRLDSDNEEVDDPDEALWADLTDQARSESGSALIVIRASGKDNDSFYICAGAKFPGALFDVTVNGVDNGTLAGAWQYPNEKQADDKPKTWKALTPQDDTTLFTSGTGSKEVKWIIPDDWIETKLLGIKGYWVKMLVSTEGYSTAPQVESVKVIPDVPAKALTVLNDVDGTYDFHKNSKSSDGSITDYDALPLAAGESIADEDGFSNFIIKNLAGGNSMNVYVGMVPLIQSGGGSGSSPSIPGYQRIQDGDGTTLADVISSVRYPHDSGEAKGTQSGTTLQDTDKNWGVNELQNMLVVIHLESESTPVESHTVLSNPADTITVAGWTNNPVDGQTEYKVVQTGNGLLVKMAEININAEEIIIDNVRTGVYKATPNTLSDLDQTQLLTDNKGRTRVAGGAPEGTAPVGDPVLIAGKETGTGDVLTPEVEATLKAIFVAIERIRDSAGNEALITAALNALKVDVVTALSGYDVRNDWFKFSQENDATLPSTVIAGTKTVASAGTAEALGSQVVKRGVIIQALSTNTNNVYVGGSGVTSALGIELTAGESVPIECDDVADVYIDVDTNGEGVKWTAFQVVKTMEGINHKRKHGLGSTKDHTPATLAEVNALISDATLVDEDAVTDVSCYANQQSGTNQVIPNSQWTPVILDEEQYDTDTFHKITAEDNGTATGVQTVSTLKDTSKSWGVDAYQNMMVFITGCTGIEQIRKISSNTIDTLTITPNWATTPDNTSTYEIIITTRFTIPAGKGGKHTVKPRVTFSASAVGIRGVAIFVSGVFVTNAFFNPVGVVESTAALPAFDYDFSAGDYIEMYAYQSSGGNLALISSSARVYLQLMAGRGVN